VAVLAVVDEVDSNLALARDDVLHRLRELALIGVLVAEPPFRPLEVERDEVFRAGQTPRVTGQDPVGHLLSSYGSVRWPAHPPRNEPD
jgi:hypothetical protein